MRKFRLRVRTISSRSHVAESVRHSVPMKNAQSPYHTVKYRAKSYPQANTWQIILVWYNVYYKDGKRNLDHSKPHDGGRWPRLVSATQTDLYLNPMTPKRFHLTYSKLQLLKDEARHERLAVPVLVAVILITLATTRIFFTELLLAY